jgi:hypothetical protein
VHAKTLTGRITLLNNTIADNTASNPATSEDALGGGVAILLQSDTATADITNNILGYNTTTTATCEDIFLDSDGDANSTHAAVTLKNNDFNPANGICTSNPSFAIDPSNINVIPGFEDAENGNYHLSNTYGHQHGHRPF